MRSLIFFVASIVLGLLATAIAAAAAGQTVAAQWPNSVWAAGSNIAGEMGMPSVFKFLGPVETSAYGALNSSSVQLVFVTSNPMSCGDTTYAIDSVGYVYAWGGTNTRYQSNLRSNEVTFVPTRYFGDNLYSQIACAAKASDFKVIAALDKQGQVWYVGNFNGMDPFVTTPTKIVMPAPAPVFTKITHGSVHMLLLSSDNQVYFMGKCYEGQCGQSGADPATTFNVPTRIERGLEGLQIVDIGCAQSTSIVLGSNGNLYQTGIDITMGNSSQYFTPIMEKIKLDYLASRFACGAYHCMIKIRGENAVVGIGSMNLGAQGADWGVGEYFNATDFFAGGIVSQVYSGSDVSYILTEDQRLYGVGNVLNGPLGGEATSFLTEPTLVNTTMLPANQGNITQMSFGSAHTSILTSSSKLYSYGMVQFGNLGNGQSFFMPNIQQLTDLDALDVVQIINSNQFTLILLRNGSLLASGANVPMQNNSAVFERFQVIQAPPTVSSTNFTRIALCRTYSSIAILDSDGVVWSILETSTYNATTGESTPVVTTTTNYTLPLGIVDFSCHAYGIFLLDSNGTVYAVSTMREYTSVLGIGSYTNETDFSVPIPLDVPASVRFKRVDCDRSLCLALTMDNMPYSWGQADIAMGDGNNRTHIVASPTLASAFLALLPTNATIIDMQVQGGNSMILDSLGNVYYTVRENGFEVLKTATMPSSAGKIIRIFAGENGWAAIDEYGKGFVWGSQSTGRLGDNTFVSKTNPVAALPVAENTTLHSIFVGKLTTFAFARMQCFGMLPDNAFVCNGQGSCVGPNMCSCTGNFTGPACTVPYSPVTPVPPVPPVPPIPPKPIDPEIVTHDSSQVTGAVFTGVVCGGAVGLSFVQAILMSVLSICTETTKAGIYSVGTAAARSPRRKRRQRCIVRTVADFLSGHSWLVLVAGCVPCLVSRRRTILQQIQRVMSLSVMLMAFASGSVLLMKYGGEWVQTQTLWPLGSLIVLAVGKAIHLVLTGISRLFSIKSSYTRVAKVLITIVSLLYVLVLMVLSAALSFLLMQLLFNMGKQTPILWIAVAMLAVGLEALILSPVFTLVSMGVDHLLCKYKDEPQSIGKAAKIDPNRSQDISEMVQIKGKRAPHLRKLTLGSSRSRSNSVTPSDVDLSESTGSGKQLVQGYESSDDDELEPESPVAHASKHSINVSRIRSLVEEDVFERTKP